MSATTEAGPGDAAAARQFVTFRIGPELFGLPLGEVQEIIRMPDVVQVPLAPAGLEGIANLRGAVLPVTSLRRRFGTAEAAHDDATRVVVVRLKDRPAGFVVDRMASVVTAEPGEIDDAASLGDTVRSDLLRGVIKRPDGMIQLLETARLLGEMPPPRAAAEAARAAGPALAEDAALAAQDDIQLVSFEAAGEEYAFPIGEVQEIVQLPAAITRVPQAPAAVLGVVTLRERLLPLVSLRALFGLPAGELGESCRIVVVAPDGARCAVGLVVDRVREVLRVPRGLVDPVPPLLDDGATGRLEAICRLEQGRRIAVILSAARLFGDAALSAAIGKATTEATAEEAAMTGEVAATAGEEEPFVVFRLGGEEYGVPTGAVQEIVRVPEELTRIPRTPDFIEGVVNLRGTVLPVVDQRRRFGLPELARNDRQRIMVLQIAGCRTGFIVDQVSEVLKLPRAAIEPAPALSEEQARLIRHVANIEAQKRMVLLLDPSNLLDAGELDALAAA
jgi:purine-binding chemotaxis protein CheW